MRPSPRKPAVFALPLNTHIFWPQDMGCKHKGKVIGRHLILVLFLCCLVQEIEQQLQQVTIGWRKNEEEQLKSLNLPFLIWYIGLVSFIIKLHQILRAIEVIAKERENTSKEKKKKSMLLLLSSPQLLPKKDKKKGIRHKQRYSKIQ